jgi:hypothetical protein
MRQRLAAVLAAVGVTVAGVAVAAPARADVPCTITNFSPRSVAVGLSPTVRTFGVSTSGCKPTGWSVEEAGFSFFTFDGAPQETFNPYFWANGDAGPKDVIVKATNADYSSRERVFLHGFSLLRRTTWQAGTFNAGPEPARKGRPISIKGRLLIADWARHVYVPYGGRTVGVQFRTLTGQYATVKYVTTDANGWVNTTVTAGGTGVWRLHYGGNTVAGASVPLGDAVQVIP